MKTKFRHLSLDRREAVTWVTIDRTRDRNSIHTGLMAEVEQCLAVLEENGTRAAVFTGAGETYFIGGADGIEMMQLSRKQAQAFSSRIQGLFDRLESSTLITVAAINGLCFGGGFEFALACDLRVAGPGARIGLPEVKVGLIPGGGGTQRLPRLVGTGKAMELILSGRLVNPAEAEKLGLIHLAVEDGLLNDAVDRLLTPILKQPHHALRLAKQAVLAADREPSNAGMAVESECFGRCFESSFFRDLMQQQLRDGVLTTSEDTSKL
jgi:enoyl-CoA hydratase/carnithine racemase